VDQLAAGNSFRDIREFLGRGRTLLSIPEVLSRRFQSNHKEIR